VRPPLASCGPNLENNPGRTDRKANGARRNRASEANLRRKFRILREFLAWPEKWNPMPQITLFSRQGCHLCDVAADILLRHRLTFEVIDIDADPALREQYNECVPVVVIDGKERFRGRVNELLLRRILAQDSAS